MYNYINKIDKNIYQNVYTQQLNEVECVVYAKDFFNFRKSLIRQKKAYEEFPFISAFGLKLKINEVINLAKCKIVSYIAKNTKVSSLAFVSSKVLKTEAFYTNKMYGKGCTVAIIDTGIFPHLDFVVPVNRIIKFVDLINGKEMPYDDNGHGTMVSSLACGNGVVHAGKYAGVSMRSNIIAIKAIEGSGETVSTKILQAMQWIYNNKSKYNIGVVCMSFGSNPSSNFDPLAMGAESLWRAGIVVVSAAGNSGPAPNTIKSPGINNRILTVGGLNDNREGDLFDEKLFCVADFSSRGPAGNFSKPDIIAPAVNIVGASHKGGYTIMSGTSVATPLVAGIAALIKGSYPNITPDQVKVRLVKCCNQITKDKNSEGFGLIDCRKLFV